MVYIHSFTFFNFGRPPSRRSVVLGDELARVGRRQRRRTGCFEGDDLAWVRRGERHWTRCQEKLESGHLIKI